MFHDIIQYLQNTNSSTGYTFLDECDTGEGIVPAVVLHVQEKDIIVDFLQFGFNRYNEDDVY